QDIEARETLIAPTLRSRADSQAAISSRSEKFFGEHSPVLPSSRARLRCAKKSVKRLVARVLMFFVAAVLAGGAATAVSVWHRDSSRPGTVVTAPPVATPVVTPTPTASAPAPIPIPA